jgi:Bifunctional DNA primase/polymerase, N-terminal
VDNLTPSDEVRHGVHGFEFPGGAMLEIHHARFDPSRRLWAQVAAKQGEGMLNRERLDWLDGGLRHRCSGGGSVVAPPSLHARGRRYEGEASSHPDDMPLAPLPDGLLVLLQIPGPGRAAAPPPDEPRMPAGQRHNTLTSVAGSMRRRGMGGAPWMR